MPETIDTILKDMKNFRTSTGGTRDVNDYGVFKVRTLESKLWIGTKSILFRAEVDGDTGGYITQIQFFDVEFSDVKKQGYHQVVDKASKKIWYYKTLDYKKNRVALYCNCSDMRFTFSWELNKKSSWIGSPRKYKRVPGSKRPPRNPIGAMGICKHIWSLLKVLENGGVLK